MAQRTWPPVGETDAKAHKHHQEEHADAAREGRVRQPQRAPERTLHHPHGQDQHEEDLEEVDSAALGDAVEERDLLREGAGHTRTHRVPTCSTMVATATTMMTPASSHFQMANGRSRAGKAKTIAECPEAANLPATNPATTASTQATTPAMRRRRDDRAISGTDLGRMGAKAREAASFTGRVAGMSDDVGVDALVGEDHDHGHQRLEVRMAVGAARFQGYHQEDHEKEDQPGG